MCFSGSKRGSAGSREISFQFPQKEFVDYTTRLVAKFEKALSNLRGRIALSSVTFL
jgi:hypothetical protein